MNSSPEHKRHRFPPQIIAHAVWLYFRFPVSLRLVEEMLLERGLVLSYVASDQVVNSMSDLLSSMLASRQHPCARRPAGRSRPCRIITTRIVPLKNAALEAMSI